MGGIKRGYSPPGLPLRVAYQRVTPAPTVRAAIEAHLLLIYTGKQVRDLVPTHPPRAQSILPPHPPCQMMSGVVDLTFLLILPSSG